jgi:hypothetical protein
MSYIRQLKKQTGTLLADLGDSADGVAESLRTAGVNGVRQNNRSCAVALYVQALMGSDPRIRSVAVGHCALQISVAAPPEFRPAGRLLVQLPKPVRQFVAAFDAGRYPMVVREQPVGPPVSGTVAQVGQR